MTPAFNYPLGPDDLRAAGIPEPWNFGWADRVRFGEIDVLGHVNNVAYATWFETARVHYLREYGFSTIKDPNTKLVLRSVSLTYLKEVLLEDAYVLTVRTRSLRNSSFVVEFGVWVNGVLTTTGDAVSVMLNPDNSKKAIPDAMRRTLIDRDGAVQD